MSNAVEDSYIDRVDVHKLMEQLSARDFLILRSRFGFNGPEQTFKAIARPLGITPCRAVQLHNRALQRMRRVMHGISPRVTYANKRLSA